MINQFENITYDSVKYIFNGEHYSIKTFLSLLNAVANDELDSPETYLDDEVIYNYRMIRPIIENFVNETIYESIYKSDMYDGLIKGLIDIFSCLHTVVYMRKHISDVDIQPKEVVYNYLQSFGFPAISEFNDYQKKEIARNVYGFIRKKGTPEIIKRILGQLGYPFFCICEFWLTKNQNGRYILRPEIIEEFSNFRTLDTNWELFLRNKDFTLEEVRNIDPLWVLSDAELNTQIETGNMTLPAKTAYFRFGVAASITDDERLVSSILYAMAKKNLYEYQINELVRDIRFPLYSKYKLSPLDLIYAYAILGFNFGKTYDIFGLNAKPKDGSNIFDIEGTLKKFDKEMVFDTISKRSIYTASNPSNNNYHRLITTKCIGWNGDITTTPIGDSIKEIRNLYNETYNLIKYYPTRVKFNEATGTVDIETPKTRYAEKNAINKKYFISNALFGDIDDTLLDFEKYNSRFCNFVKETINKYEVGSDEYKTNIYNFMFEIIKSLEMYIYNKSGIQFNMKQQFIKYSDFNSTTRLISNSFAPYHTKMFDSLYLYIIRELPFDQILVSDTSTKNNGMGISTISMNCDPYWKRLYINTNNTSFEYKDIISYLVSMGDRDILNSQNMIEYLKNIKNNEYINNMINNDRLPIPYPHDTINNGTYRPIYQFEMDHTKSNGKSELYSGYKRKLTPHLITTNVKMRFIVILDRQINSSTQEEEIASINIYLIDGSDNMTKPLKIFSRISPNMYKGLSQFIVEVQETYYDQYTDYNKTYKDKKSEEYKEYQNGNISEQEIPNKPRNNIVKMSPSQNNVNSFYKSHPESGQTINIDSTDDPRWNDRIDTIKISKYTDKVFDSSGYLFLGSVVSGDVVVNVNTTNNN